MRKKEKPQAKTTNISQKGNTGDNRRLRDKVFLDVNNLGKADLGEVVRDLVLA